MALLRYDLHKRSGSTLSYAILDVIYGSCQKLYNHPEHRYNVFGASKDDLVQRGMILHHTTSGTFKHKRWMHKFEFIVDIYEHIPKYTYTT